MGSLCLPLSHFAAGRGPEWWHGSPREGVESPSLVIIHCTDAALHEQGLNQTPLSLCDLRDSMNTLEMPL